MPCPPLGLLPDPGIKPRSPVLQADSLPSELPENPTHWLVPPKCQYFMKCYWTEVTVLQDGKDCGNQNFQTRVMARWWEKNLTISSNIRQLKCPLHTGQPIALAELCLMALPLSDGTGCFLQVDVFQIAVLLQIRTCPVICWGPEALRSRTRNESFLVAKPNVPSEKPEPWGNP